MVNLLTGGSAAAGDGISLVVVDDTSVDAFAMDVDGATKAIAAHDFMSDATSSLLSNCKGIASSFDIDIFGMMLRLCWIIPMLVCWMEKARADGKDAPIMTMRIIVIENDRRDLESVADDSILFQLFCYWYEILLDTYQYL